jgi:hypothetical protein
MHVHFRQDCGEEYCPEVEGLRTDGGVGLGGSP